MERKQRNAEEKAKTAMEAVREHKLLHEIAQAEGVHPDQISEWKWMLFPACRSFRSFSPVELEESAWIDGANRLQASFRIVLPLIVPGIIGTGLFAFVLAWNDLLFAMILARSTSVVPAAVVLNNLAHSQFAGTNYGGLLAGGVVLTLPAVILLGLRSSVWNAYTKVSEFGILCACKTTNSTISCSR